MLKNGQLINPEVRIENTNKCNAGCIICPREKLTRPLATMCNGFFTSLVDQSVELGARTISVFGYGEPCIDKELPYKIGYCSDNGLDTFITTNGSLLDYDFGSELLDAGLKNIRFSFHAITPLHHEHVHKLQWLKVYRNFGNFVELNKLRGRPCKIHISCIPMHGETVEEIRTTWERFCDYLEIWRPHNWGGGRNYRTVFGKKKTCGRPFNGPVQIQVDGTVIPCCFLTNSELVLGDTNDDTILNILNNSAYRRLRSKHSEGDMVGLPCRDCDQRNEEQESPLSYSNRDPECATGKTSTCKLSVN